MTGQARAQASEHICGMLNTSPMLRDARCVMLYDAMDDEPNVGAVASAALAGGKTVCYPRIDWEHRVLTPIAVESHEFPRMSQRHGVPEPSEGREVDAREIDLVIVPGVAFDSQGARLGRGGGFYDRFLSTLVMRVERGGAHAIGVCFDCQRVARLVVETHDACVDAVVTEKGVFPSAK